MSTRSPEPLPRSFYEPSAKEVAPRLLGHLLLRRMTSGRWAGGPIVETEAYLADDPACHGYRGQTARNRSMYGPPGFAYVYFIYGNYWCFNAVCAAAGVAEAVLIRAIEPQMGIEAMRENRSVSKTEDLSSGPAKLCLALDIKREHDGLDICRGASGLIIAANSERDRFVASRSPVITTTRVGITQAAHLPLRHYLEGSRFVSRRAR